MERKKRFISNEEAADLGLPLNRGDVREDGFIFKRYYESSISGQIREIWQSPEAREKDKSRRRESSKRRQKMRPRKMEHLRADERDKLGLELRIGNTREDGFVFKNYYKRGDVVYEFWVSPENYSKILDRKRKHQERKRKSNSEFTRRVKLFLGCQMCGYKKHPDALHFDHVNPSEKYESISKLYTGSRIRLKKEMKKCRVLCANCHAEHTANQRENGVFDETF